MRAAISRPAGGAARTITGTPTCSPASLAARAKARRTSGGLRTPLTSPAAAAGSHALTSTGKPSCSA